MVKGDGHRSRDADRYAFMQENIAEYAQQMKRKYMTCDVLNEDYLKTTDKPYGYTQLKAIIQKYEKNHDYKYHNIYEPGREMSILDAKLYDVSQKTVCINGIKFNIKCIRTVARYPFVLLSFLMRK